MEEVKKLIALLDAEPILDPREVVLIDILRRLTAAIEAKQPAEGPAEGAMHHARSFAREPARQTRAKKRKHVVG